jgi:cysteinyl-tRNA synthetase
MLRIYNTLSRQKEEFVPLVPGKVKLYACGPTVYNYFHIGNARAFITFDVVRSYLEYKGFDVTYVQNITDIDDKLINQSLSEGRSVEQIAQVYSNAFLEDTARLGIRKPHHQPRATQYIGKMIAVIKELVEHGYAYESHGDVYFSVTRLPSYGSLSGKNIDDLRTGARVEENTQKQHPADFTLWKAAKPGEPSWGSPWGKGRPGWHTECVAMSRDLLGETFDIHGGGSDLVFPHHENELAQAQALTGKPLANYWMHNGFLNIEGEKMSKSLGNFFTARDILAQYDAEAIRFFFLSKHYRSPIDFNRELIEESLKAIGNFYGSLADIYQPDMEQTLMTVPEELSSAKAAFVEAMDDDFNTARALAVLFDLAGKAKNATSGLAERRSAGSLLIELGRVLGFFSDLPSHLTKPVSPQLQSQIEAILAERQSARQNKDWASSDALRDQLIAMGVEIKDTKDGTTWKLL